MKKLWMLGLMFVSSLAFAEAGLKAKSGRSADLGYIWANQPTTASYIPSTTYQYNSTGAVNSVTRIGVGTYQVNFPNFTTIGGNVQVTAYGSGPEHCKVSSWGPSGANLIVNVRCFNPNGSLVDTLYDVLFIN